MGVSGGSSHPPTDPDAAQKTGTAIARTAGETGTTTTTKRNKSKESDSITFGTNDDHDHGQDHEAHHQDWRVPAKVLSKVAAVI